MRTILTVLVCFALASCATSGTEIQAECEAKHREFPDIFQCTYENVAARNPGILQDARAKLYLLRGEQLALEVVEKKITSLDAKVAWQRLYVELKSAKDQEVAATANAISRNLEVARAAATPMQPTQAQITAPARTVNCTSTKLGATVYTTCQ